jgi:hypothetical protein
MGQLVLGAVLGARRHREQHDRRDNPFPHGAISSNIAVRSVSLAWITPEMQLCALVVCYSPYVTDVCVAIRGLSDGSGAWRLRWALCLQLFEQ